MSRFWSWLAAPTRAFTAERRVNPQSTDHLYLTVGAFRLAGCGARKYSASRRLGIDGIGLASAILVATPGADHLGDLYPSTLQEASQTSSEGARAFYSSVLQGAELLCPVHEPFVACQVRRYAQGAPMPADPVQGNGDVDVLVGVHPQSDRLGICRDASAHVSLPSLGG